MAKKKVAVVGGGVAGIVSAYCLDSGGYDVTILEKNDYVGGHTNTITFEEYPGKSLAIDTGFIVFNNKNYPNFMKFLNLLMVPWQDSDMSFGFSSEQDDFYYNSYVPKGLFAQFKNLIRPKFYQMIRDILKFNKQASSDLEQHRLGEIGLGEYLNAGKYSSAFMDYYLIPMGAAIWSTPLTEMLNFPAKSFIQFFSNHGLLALKNRPHWKTVVGGSRTYVEKFLSEFTGDYRTGVEIDRVLRLDHAVQIHFKDKSIEEYDLLVVATHADEALKLLSDPTSEEKKLLGAWTYSRNKTVLHTDKSVMPLQKKAWASWNYRVEEGQTPDQPVTLTYHMNRLQNLETENDYFVTLNRQLPIARDKIIREFNYTHPNYTNESMATQEFLDDLNGVKRTYFCGSYFGYGFHEDAVTSAVKAVAHLGLTL
jgi:predicted NAD/FAD-binding protein